MRESACASLKDSVIVFVCLILTVGSSEARFSALEIKIWKIQITILFFISFELSFIEFFVYIIKKNGNSLFFAPLHNFCIRFGYFVEFDISHIAHRLHLLFLILIVCISFFLTKTDFSLFLVISKFIFKFFLIIFINSKFDISMAMVKEWHQWYILSPFREWLLNFN